MDYFSLHLTSLRQEISDLRDLNVLYLQQAQHSSVEQTASDVRSSRLLQIKRELSDMLNCRPDPKVWWDKVRKPMRAAYSAPDNPVRAVAGLELRTAPVQFKKRRDSSGGPEEQRE